MSPRQGDDFDSLDAPKGSGTPDKGAQRVTKPTLLGASPAATTKSSSVMPQGTFSKWIAGHPNALLNHTQDVTAFGAVKSNQETTLGWTRNSGFQTAVGVVICLNAITLGLEVDKREAWGDFFVVTDHCFTAVFVIEMLTRWYVEGLRRYFSESSSVLDFIIVLFAVLDVWILGPLSASAVDLRVMSVLRLVRLFRLARIARLFRLFKELAVICGAFKAGLRTLLWGGIFLLIVVYVFAIFAAERFGRSISPGELGVDESYLFGSLSSSMLTHFVCITDGCGEGVVEPMTRNIPWTVAYWLLFVFVTSFGILNIMVGIFCESVLEKTQEVEQDLKRSREHWRHERLRALQKLFSHMDLDRNGFITRREWVEAIETIPEVQQCLEELELDHTEQLFDKMDLAQSCELSLQEFFDGFMIFERSDEPARREDCVPTYLLSRSLQADMGRLMTSVGGISPGSVHSTNGCTQAPERDARNVIPTLHDRLSALDGKLEGFLSGLSTQWEQVGSTLHEQFSALQATTGSFYDGLRSDSVDREQAGATLQARLSDLDRKVEYQSGLLAKLVANQPEVVAAVFERVSSLERRTEQIAHQNQERMERMEQQNQEMLCAMRDLSSAVSGRKISNQIVSTLWAQGTVDSPVEASDLRPLV